MSTAQGTKSIYLAKRSISKEYDYVCYDPECISELFEKPAVECLEMFNKLEFSHWFDDANTAINYIKQNNPGGKHKILMVGSSMGGWITLSMAKKISRANPRYCANCSSVEFYENGISKVVQ